MRVIEFPSLPGVVALAGLYRERLGETSCGAAQAGGVANGDAGRSSFSGVVLTWNSRYGSTSRYSAIKNI